MVWDFLANRAKQSQRINVQGLRENSESVPFQTGAGHGDHTALNFATAPNIDEISTGGLSVVNNDQLPVGLQTTPVSASWSPPMIDGISISEDPTWLLPAMPKSGGTGNQVLAPATQTSGGESYLGLIRDLVKNSGIYAVASLTSPLVTLLLSPFLAHMLSRTDYGALAVLTTVVTLVAGVAGLGLGPAFTRLYLYDCKTKRGQLDALSTLVLLSLLILIPIVSVGVIASSWLSILILGSTSYASAVQVAAVLVLTQNLTIPSLVWFRAESRAGLFATIAIANLLITAGANIVLVGRLHMGIAGSLVANGLGDSIIVVCTLPVIFWCAGFRLRLVMAVSMLTFGVPHIVNLLSGWVLQLSDRYLLEHFASLSLAAGYSVAYSLGGVTSSAIIAPFSLAWWVIMYPIAKRKDAKQVFKLIFRGFSFVLLFATLGLSLFGKAALELLFPTSYHAQALIIPIIALSTLFNGIATVVGLGMSLLRKTWLISISFIISALINAGLNMVLIPVHGAMGAALATLVAYIVMALLAYLWNQWLYPVPFEVGLFLIALGIGIALYLLANGLTKGEGFVMALPTYIGILLLYGLCLSLLGWFLHIKRRMLSFIKHMLP